MVGVEMALWMVDEARELWCGGLMVLEDSVNQGLIVPPGLKIPHQRRHWDY